MLQLSDLHVTARGDLHGQDPRANLDRILADVDRRGLAPDVVVATGDLADDGDPAAYRWLHDRLAGLGVPVHCLAGNHDREPAFTEGLPGGPVRAERIAEVGGWRFLFVDTNAAGRTVDAAGAVVDAPDRRHGARAGALLPTDAEWLVDALAHDPTAPVVVWMHHPAVAHPAFAGLGERPFSRWLCDVVAAAGTVRAVSSGHVHSAHDTERGGVRHLTCPSGWLTLDLDTGTLVPPGYRTFTLHPDGSLDTTAHVVDDDGGPAPTPFPAWIPKVLAEGG